MRTFYSDPSDDRRESEFRARHELPHRGRAMLWSSIALLAAAVGVLYWIGLYDNGAKLNELPSLKTALTTMGERIYQVEQKFRNFDPEAYERRLTSLEKNVQTVETRFADARKKADGAASATAVRLRSEFGRRHHDIEARLARLENDWQSDRAQVASLQGELSRVKHELTNHETRMAAGERNSSQDKAIVEQTLEQRIADVRREIVGNQRDLDRLARGLEVQRIDFEVSRKHTYDVAPGVSLHLTGIDVAHRQVKGWMWIMPDRKTVWLRDQNAMQPVIFYSKTDGKKREVVFTHVTKDSAVGYVLLPATAPTEVAADSIRTTARNSGGD